MKIDRSMFNIENHAPAPPLIIKPWLEEWREAMIEDCLDTIRFLQDEIKVCVMVIELCGAYSKTGQTCDCQIRLHETEIEAAKIRLQKYRNDYANN